MAIGDGDGTCEIPMCGDPAITNCFLCPHHWLFLPKRQRDEVWGLYRVGQQPSAEYLTCATACIDAVIAEEARRFNVKVKAPSAKAQREAAAVKRLVVEMGAEVVFTMKPYEPLSKVARMKARQVDVDDALMPEWPDALTAASQVAVVWDTPEHAATGSASWRLLRHAIRSAGLVNVTHTWLVPQMLRDDAGQARAPKADELAEWRERWFEQMAAADTRYALLVGGVVGNVWRSDVGYQELVGRWGAWHGRWWCQVIPHPGAVARGLVSAKDFRVAVGEFATRVLAGDDMASTFLGRDCTEAGCAERWWALDRDGLPWCEAHGVKHLTGAKGGGRRTKRTGQGVML